MSRTEQAELDLALGCALRDFGAARELVARGEGSLRDLGAAMAEYAQRRREIADRQREFDTRRAEECQAFPQHWHDERQQEYDDALATSAKLAGDAETLTEGRVPSDLPLPRDLLKVGGEERSEGEALVRRAQKFLDAHPPACSQH